MANLDQLTRSDLLKVLKDLEYQLGIEEAARNRIKDVKNVFAQNEKDLFSLKKRRIIFMLFVVFFTFSPMSVSFYIICSSVYGLFTGGNDADDTVVFTVLSIIGCVVIVAIIFIYLFIIKYFKKKNKEEREKVEKYNSGIYAYIPYYENIRQDAENKISSLCGTYNVHPSLKNISAVSYVRKQLSSYSTMSLQKAIDDFYEMQHRESMLNEAQRQSSILTNIRKDNQEFYDKALERMDESNQIERDIRESVDYIRYWK